MRKIIFLLPFIFSFGCIYGGDGDYAVSKISPALLKNADVVLRLEEITFEIKSAKESYERNHYVITILNENGDKWAQFNDYYDKLREIISVEGYLYDANGKQLKKMKTRDMQDVSGVDEISLMDDNRLKLHNFYYKVYPYTIEYEVVVRNKNTLFFPTWMPQGGEKLSVELSRITVIAAPEYKFRYKAFNYSGDPATATVNGKLYFTWTAKDLATWKKEIYSPDWYEQVICVWDPLESTCRHASLSIL